MRKVRTKLVAALCLYAGTAVICPYLNVSMSRGGVTGVSLTLRGWGTMSLNSGEPVVLVVDVQMDPNLVTPDDIESISVLKDTSSFAICGARAVYGVILITTKNNYETIQF